MAKKRKGQKRREIILQLSLLHLWKGSRTFYHGANDVLYDMNEKKQGLGKARIVGGRHELQRRQSREGSEDLMLL